MVSMENQRFREWAGNFVRVGVWALSLSFLSVFVAACGACWPGPCVDGSSPEPPSPDCSIPRQPEAVSPYLWQATFDEGFGACPRLLLDPAGPRYDDWELCEIGLRQPTDDAAGTAFFVRYACNSGAPWEMVLTDPANLEDSDTDLDLRKSCAALPLDVAESFTRGQTLEGQLWAENEAAIKAVVSDWEEGCRSADATEERLETCANVCDRVDQGAGSGTSLRKALAKSGISTTPEVDCYLALFDEVPASGEAIGTSDGQVDPISGKSACACRPNDIFFNLLTEDCFPSTSLYEESCGRTSWSIAPSSGESCDPIPVQ